MRLLLKDGHCDPIVLVRMRLGEALLFFLRVWHYLVEHSGALVGQQHDVSRARLGVSEIEAESSGYGVVEHVVAERRGGSHGRLNLRSVHHMLLLLPLNTIISQLTGTSFL